MENIEETSVVTETTESTNTVDIETLQAKLDEAESKNKELWDKIYKLKKESKNTSETTTWFWKEDIDNMLNERDFYKSNPNLVEHKEAIQEFTSKGLTHKQAMKLVIDADSTIAARQNTNNANFTSWTPDYSTGHYTMEEFAKIGKTNPSKYTELLRDYKAGKITVK